MNKLPVELLPFVLNKVHQTDLWACSLVNRSFYTATIPFLWRCYSEDSSDAPSRLLDCLEATPPHPLRKYLRQLKLDSGWNGTHLLLLIPHLSLLEDLMILNRASIRNLPMDQLPQHCPNLKTLRLWNFDVTQETMDALGQYCHQLEELQLNSCSDLSTTTNSLFASFVRRHHPLKKLVISNRHDGNHWNDKTVMDLTRLTQLTEFYLGNYAAHLLDRLVPTATATATPVTVWPHLTHLSIHHLYTVGDSQLIPLIQTHPRLQYLSLHQSDLTDATLDAIATCLPELTHLDLDWDQCITAPGLRRLIQHRCPRLTHVDLFQCDFSTADFPEPGENCQDLDETIHGHCMLYCLDQEALNKIRRGADHVNLQQ